MYTFPLFPKNLISLISYISKIFVLFMCFLPNLRAFCFLPILTMTHLCIMQCTYWTPLVFPEPHTLLMDSSKRPLQITFLLLSCALHAGTIVSRISVERLTLYTWANRILR